MPRRSVPHSSCHTVCARAGQCASSASSQKRSPLASISRPRAPPARRRRRRRRTGWAARADRPAHLHRVVRPRRVPDQKLGQLPAGERERLRRVGGVARQQAPLGAVLAFRALEQVDAADFGDAGDPRDLDVELALAHVPAERPARRRCRRVRAATTAASALRAPRRASRRDRIRRESSPRSRDRAARPRSR